MIDAFRLNKRVEPGFDRIALEEYEQNIGDSKGKDKYTDTPKNGMKSSVWENPSI